MVFLWKNRWVLTGTSVAYMKEHKSILEIRKDPFFGTCDICRKKDILTIKGGVHGLYLVCRTCNDDLNNPNIKLLSNTK